MRAQSESHPHTYTHGSLLLNDFQVPKRAKINGFELHLKGIFESISNIPAGWKISLDNNASDEAVLIAKSADGHSSAINEAALRNIGIQIVGREFEADRVHIWGSLYFSTDDGLDRVVPWNRYSFKFYEKFHRHRLSADAISQY